MDLNFPTHVLPLAALYPEIHYRFKAFPFSLYHHKQPEIIADAPFRLEPGSALPVLLLVKDADRFPILIDSVRIDGSAHDRRVTQVLSLRREMIKQHWWHHIEWVELPDESPCTWEIAVSWNVEIGGRRYVYQTSNLPKLANSPLLVQHSGYSLPRKEGWVYGDLHAHTAYTEDQVEFGAPLAAYPALGKAAGLSFVMAADHGYDLDDLPESFTRTDPQLTRFHYRNTQIDRLNVQHEGHFCVLPGYELSAGNARDKNVHLLLMNQKDYLPGSGDSAEHWFQFKPELSIGDALNQMNSEALAVAAHPFSKPPLLQQWLLGRGRWEMPDLEHGQLLGLQIWNGENGDDFEQGLKEWIRGLLEGKKWRAFAGSDAHGNFNRHLKVATPMLKLTLATGQLCGCVRTGIYLPDNIHTNTVLSALRSAPCIITDGPFAELKLESHHTGDSIVAADVLSSIEFGGIEKVRLLWGNTGEKKEEVIYEQQYPGEDKVRIAEAVLKQEGYIRLEAGTLNDKRVFTNPLYLNEPL